MDKVIIADAGLLIAFGRIKHINLLVETLGTVIASVSVLKECVANVAQSGAKEIAEAVSKGLIESHVDPDTNQNKNLLEILGVGEASAIALATQLKAGLLIDEKLGRKTAQKMNLKVIGTAGTLLLAKEKKLIKKVAPFIHELKNSGYYLSQELIDSVLIKAKEK